MGSLNNGIKLYFILGAIQEGGLRKEEVEAKHPGGEGMLNNVRYVCVRQGREVKDRYFHLHHGMKICVFLVEYLHVPPQFSQQFFTSDGLFSKCIQRVPLQTPHYIRKP